MTPPSGTRPRIKADSSNPPAKAILSGGEPLMTTDHVLIEAWTLLHHRLGRRPAERFWEAMRSGAATVAFVGPADLEAAWEIEISYRDQFSIVDRTSFAVMRRLGLEPGRRRSFTVIRQEP